VFPLPRFAWRPAEDFGADISRTAVISVSRVVDDTVVVQALAKCWGLPQDAVYVLSGDEFPPGSAERIVERAVVEEEWPLRLTVPLADRDALDRAELAKALEPAFDARCLVKD
jgi:hypothetical protein